jgi:hypothetical protein
MHESNLHARVSPMKDGQRHKMRKVRKGTQSCWECKRRKIRCIFTSSNEAVCESCKRRATKCIGQELPDEQSLGVEQRLDRMEAILEQMRTGTDGASKDLPPQAIGDRHGSRNGRKSSAGTRLGINIPALAPPNIDGLASHRSPNREKSVRI